MLVVVVVAAIGNRVAAGWRPCRPRPGSNSSSPCLTTRSTIRSSADIITAVLLLLVVGVAVSQLAARARRLQVTTITDAGYLAQIHQTALLTPRPLGRPMPLPITSGSSSSGCSIWRVAAFSMIPCSAVRRAWSQMAT